jgi:uncharacterized iron-regulated membrane protein
MDGVFIRGMFAILQVALIFLAAIGALLLVAVLWDTWMRRRRAAPPPAARDGEEPGREA